MTRLLIRGMLLALMAALAACASWTPPSADTPPRFDTCAPLGGRLEWLG